MCVGNLHSYSVEKEAPSFTLVPAPMLGLQGSNLDNCTPTIQTTATIGIPCTCTPCVFVRKSAEFRKLEEGRTFNVHVQLGRHDA
jgi:hypothetical protein